MAILGTTLCSIISGSTAGNVNGCFFDYSGTNYATDLTTDTNTGNTSSPVVSSASYNFVAGDVDCHVYVSSGTNWKQGWYKVASVASNKATLSAAVGEATEFTTVLNPTMFTTNTSVGCATVGTPTGGVWTIDRSRKTTCNNSTTNNLASSNATNATPTVTSASYTFTVADIGNYIRINAGTSWTVGWYRITNVSGGGAILDRACGSSASVSSGTWRVGGSASLNSTLDDDLFEIGGTTTTASCNFLIKNGSYSLGESVSISAVGSRSARYIILGYNSVVGDTVTESQKPIINASGSLFSIGGSHWSVYNINFTGSSSYASRSTANTVYYNCSFRQLNTTSSNYAFNTGGGPQLFINCVFSALNGYGYLVSASSTGHTFINCLFIGGSRCHRAASAIAYLHSFHRCIFIPNSDGYALENTSNPQAYDIVNCTLYQPNTASTTDNGYLGTSSGPDRFFIMNSSFVNFNEALEASSTAFQDNISWGNNYYNNSTDVVNCKKSVWDIDTDPNYSSLTTLSGSTATTSGSDITQSGAFAGVVAGDHIMILSGTGVTAGCYKVTAATTNTLTLDVAPGNSAVADKSWICFTNLDFSVGDATLHNEAPIDALQQYPEVSFNNTIGAIIPLAEGGAAEGAVVF